MAGQFVSQEKVLSIGRSFATLYRLVASLTLLRRLFIPTIILSLIAVALPQAFLWMAGLRAQCTVESNACVVHLPILDLDISLTLRFLTVLAVVAFIIRIASWVIFEIGGFWSLQQFHHRMVQGLRRVRTTYFDENPSGRLINRMVNDYENLKSSCIVRMGDTMQALLEVVSVAGMVLVAHPLGAALIVPTVASFLFIQWSVAPMLQRLSAIRSIRMGVVLHRETDLIDGARTFVLYGAEQALLIRLREAIRRYVQVHLNRVRIEAWGRLLSSAVTSTYSFLALLFVALAVQRGAISFILGSAIVTIILRLTPACSWLAWSVGLLIESVGVAKRTFEIADLPAQESEEFAFPLTRMSDGDVARIGDLTFLNYSMSYRPDSPIILNDLTLTIKAGEKIGIIGRTGAGKSSIMQSLFRMVYVTNGDITFAGKSLLCADIMKVRALFGVVPQDPYLFSGTVRSNLDPEHVLRDDDLVSSLERVGLSIPLETEILEGGKNMSLGERQLVCLARVIAHDKPIVLLDEPTSAVDNVTDAKIQAALQKTLGGRTVIAIAHRVETLREYDRVLVIQDGKVVREGTPAEMA